MMRSLLAMILLGLVTLVVAIPAPPTADSSGANTTTHSTSKWNWKRGLAYNDPRVTYLFNSHKITWMYNWGHQDNGANTQKLEYVPMLWSNRQPSINNWHSDVAKYSKGRTLHALGFNEPDMTTNGGSNMPSLPGTATAYRAWITEIKHYAPNLWIGSPAVTNGARGPSGKMGLDWLSDFLSACRDCSIDFVAIHWYDSYKSVDYFKAHVTKACQVAGGRPLWITEFAPDPWGTGEAEQIAFLRSVMPWLDANDCVERYAFFMATPGMLVSGDGQGLSELGKVYAYA
ncbi:hypothetical protein EJ04DRAFT_582016 [Polyplosphaeria fusca]|uniref:Asl1-like glycosyl hydrolase catalytic domain-containing protein n=1 Tax=Polyplosphaeria fusca TaxID=682080 RepID=A0A9P4UW47_9PLEO|nr:hypothetical protein EJ04DRAFT_582016 [Polyplosphaeria fusca]